MGFRGLGFRAQGYKNKLYYNRDLVTTKRTLSLKR